MVGADVGIVDGKKVGFSNDTVYGTSVGFTDGIDMGAEEGVCLVMIGALDGADDGAP